MIGRGIPETRGTCVDGGGCKFSDENEEMEDDGDNEVNDKEGWLRTRGIVQRIE